jgi:hypothetical protein
MLDSAPSAENQSLKPRVDAVETPTDFRYTGPALHALGYRVTPIRTRSKAPFLDGWRQLALTQTADDVCRLAEQYGDCGCGIVTGRQLGLDIDVLHQAAAVEIAELAWKMFGRTSARFGRAPKMMLPFRTEDTIGGSIATRWFIRSDGQRHRVEWIINTQYVAFGTHPSTGRPYRWLRPSLLDIPADDLPLVTELQMREFIAAAEAILLRYGFEPVQATTTTVVAAPLNGTPPASMANHQSSSLAAAQANLPGRRFEDLPTDKQNDWLFKLAAHPDFLKLADAGRDEWRNLVFAFAHAEQGGATEARSICEAWSKQSPKWNQRQFNGAFKVRANGDNKTVAELIKIGRQIGVPSPWEDDQPQSTTVVNSAALAQAFGSGNSASFFETLSFEQADLQPLTWLVMGFLIRGELSVLAGQGGGSKTALAILVAVALAAGLTRLGPFQINNRPGGLRVAYITGEEDSNRLRLLIAAACRVLALNAAERALVRQNLVFHDAAASGLRIGAPRPGMREDLCPEDQDRALNQLTAALAGTDVAIFDTMSALFALANENDNQSVTSMMRRLIKTARAVGCAMLILHHVPKMSREAAAAQRGEPTLVRGGGAIVNSARVVLTVTSLPLDEAAQLALMGLEPDRGRRLEHVKINDCPMMAPSYFALRSEPVKVSDGSEVSVRAVEWVSVPAASGATADVLRELVMRAVDAGVIQHGVRVPLSPGGGRKNERDGIYHIAHAIIHARPSLQEEHAKSLAKSTLKDLEKLGCVVTDEDAQIPKYKDGRRDGSRKGKGLSCRWDRALWTTSQQPAAAAQTNLQSDGADV